jgi:hypothetical protein
LLINDDYSDKQYALANTLDRMERDQERHFSGLVRQLTQLRFDITAHAKNTTDFQSIMLANKLEAAQRLATFDLPEESILASLQYSDMANRQGMISAPNHSTYDWIFRTADSALPLVTYISWLETGDGVFWVTGKAGSGKSTLMKHICNDPRTRAALEKWAASRKLLIASHYFWYLGSPMEKSYSGLLKSILYDVLNDRPDLIKSVCKVRWADALEGKDIRRMSWSDDNLRECVESLVTSDLETEGQSPCFCFFVDGLDEYHGDQKLVELLVRLASTGHTKICASSRPWNKFQDAFVVSKQQGRYLELHQHTRPDIAKVVEGELGTKLINIDRTGDDWTSLVQEVIERDEGVFLWVILVLKKELVPYLENREGINFLRKQLDAVPNGTFPSLCVLLTSSLIPQQILTNISSTSSTGSGGTPNIEGTQLDRSGLVWRQGVHSRWLLSRS